MQYEFVYWLVQIAPFFSIPFQGRDSGVIKFNSENSGRIVYEEHTDALTFNPFIMLFDDRYANQTNQARHAGLAKVPSLFGGVGENRKETSFFHRYFA